MQALYPSRGSSMRNLEDAEVSGTKRPFLYIPLTMPLSSSRVKTHNEPPLANLDAPNALRKIPGPQGELVNVFCIYRLNAVDLLRPTLSFPNNHIAMSKPGFLWVKQKVWFYSLTGNPLLICANLTSLPQPMQNQECRLDSRSSDFVYRSQGSRWPTAISRPYQP
jgi:hypothetical protein